MLVQVGGFLVGSVDSESLDSAVASAPPAELLAARAWAEWLLELVGRQLDQVGADQVSEHYAGVLLGRGRPVAERRIYEKVDGRGMARRCAACGSELVRDPVVGFRCVNGCSGAND